MKDLSFPVSTNQPVANALNDLLADCFALYLKTKNFHWHVSGPHFRDYHLMFDAQASQILAVTDAIAERVRKIGGATLRSIGDVARRQQIRDNDAARVTAEEMITELLNDNRGLIASLRTAKDIAVRAEDHAASSLIDALTDQAEERAWFLFEAAGG